MCAPKKLSRMRLRHLVEWCAWADAAKQLQAGSSGVTGLGKLDTIGERNRPKQTIMSNQFLATLAMTLPKCFCHAAGMPAICQQGSAHPQDDDGRPFLGSIARRVGQLPTHIGIPHQPKHAEIYKRPCNKHATEKLDHSHCSVLQGFKAPPKFRARSRRSLIPVVSFQVFGVGMLATQCR